MQKITVWVNILQPFNGSDCIAYTMSKQKKMIAMLKLLKVKNLLWDKITERMFSRKKWSVLLARQDFMGLLYEDT